VDVCAKKTGFVLLAALVVLGLAGVVMMAAVRYSSALALQANTARERMQLRWATISLQRAVLSNAEHVISEDEAQTGMPLTWARRRICLNNGMQFDLIFGDEQAKANVNAVYARKGRMGLTVLLEALLWGHDVALRTALRPSAPELSKKEKVRRPFGCFDQLFDAYEPGDLARPFTDEEPLVGQLTCWGDGRLNFRRASPWAVREVTSGILTAYQQAQLLALRQDVPGISLEEALRQLELSDRDRPKAAAVLTDASTCYSLWIAGRTAGRRWYRLAVSNTGVADVEMFAW